MPEGEHSDSGLQATRIGLRIAKDLPVAAIGAALDTTALPALADNYSEARDKGGGIAEAIVYGAVGMAESTLTPLSARAEGGRVSRGLRRLADIGTGLGAVALAAAIKDPTVAEVIPQTLGGVQDALRAISDAAPSAIKSAPLEQVAAGAIFARNFTLNALDAGQDVVKDALRRRNQPVGRPSGKYRQKQIQNEPRQRSYR